MEPWAAVRQRAAACRADAYASAAANGADDLVRIALSAAGLEESAFTPGEPGFGVTLRARLERLPSTVYVSRTLPPLDRAFALAHELGHFHLHEDPILEDVADGQRNDGTGAATRAGGYSPRELKEAQADLFAAEFLCPSQGLRDGMLADGTRASAVARGLGVSSALVLRQAVSALLHPASAEQADGIPPATIPVLDHEQSICAQWREGPLLVTGRPGTGKTATLVARLRHLLDTGTPPASILALAHSESASEALRSTLAATHPKSIGEAWIGTFQAFAREVLLKWPEAAGRSKDLQIVDVTASHSLIGRMLASAEKAEQEAAAGRSASGADAEAAMEADVKAYGEALAAADAVEPIDVLLLAATILRTPDVGGRRFVERFRHILVDDFQDVGFAESRLLALLCESGAYLWAAGNAGQAIQGYRGASADAIESFEADHGGTRRTLSRNHRATGPAALALDAFLRDPGRPPAGRPPEVGHPVARSVAEDDEGQARALRERIEALRASGVPYRDQAILARKHASLHRIAAHLDRLDVPLLHVGDMRERSDVQDLLALSAFVLEDDEAAFRRVARMAIYSAPEEDVDVALRMARARSVGVAGMLRELGEASRMTARGRMAFAQLAADVDGLGASRSPWEALSRWLFDRSAYLRPLLRPRAGVREATSLFAIHHVLKASEEQDDLRDASVSALADRIRRIGSVDQDTHFRKVPLATSGMDAVAVMTIHAAQGLEFRAVHVVDLAAARPPRRRRDDPAAAERDLDEERRIFLSALSRSREHLHLTLAERRNGTRLHRSPLLRLIEGLVSERRVGDFAGARPAGSSKPDGCGRRG